MVSSKGRAKEMPYIKRVRIEASVSTIVNSTGFNSSFK